MKPTSLFALMPAVLLSGCALEATHRHDAGDALVKTQVAPEPLAACISQKLDGATTPAEPGGFVVETAGLPLSIQRDELQTVVRGPEGILIPNNVSELVIGCALSLAPRSHQR